MYHKKMMSVCSRKSSDIVIQFLYRFMVLGENYQPHCLLSSEMIFFNLTSGTYLEILSSVIRKLTSNDVK